jgi:hypothetical protein
VQAHWFLPLQAHLMSTANRSRWVILRDLLIFQIKLLLDGAKDIVLSPVSLGAAAIDLFLPTMRFMMLVIPKGYETPSRARCPTPRASRG